MKKNPPQPRRISRRAMLANSSAGIAAFAFAPHVRVFARGDDSLPRLPSFDEEMERYMTEREIPGGALAVARNGKLVYARGYGRADRERPEPAAPDALFRIASISKPITAAAIFKLIEQGALALDERVFARLDVKPAARNGAASKPDPRLASITVRQLLQHTAGWDRDKSFDPMFAVRKIATELGVPSPASPADIVRYMAAQPLDFDPGTRYAYSNFGYCVLGRLIELIAGEPYENFVKRAVLAPAGIRRMRLGRSLESQRTDGEVRYHTQNESATRSVFGDGSEKVSWAYGGFAIESMDAHGGWIASAIDLLRFTVALEETAAAPLLKPATLRLMFEPPPAPVSRNDDGSVAAAFYAGGWLVRPVGRAGKANHWHGGSLPGAHGLLVRRWDGLSWAVLFNQRSKDFQKRDSAIDPALHRAADAVKKWPEENLFTRFGVR